MTKQSKTLKKYIANLLPLGIFSFLTGILLAVVLFIVTVNDPMVNLPFAVLGIIAGYYVIVYLNPGIQIAYYNFSFLYNPFSLNRKKTQDEEMINKLVAINKSKTLINLVTVLFVLMVSLFSIYHQNKDIVFNVNNIIWLLFWTTLTMLILGNSIKFLSAWWNIRKYFKK